MREVKKERKIRSDKKRDVKPTIPINLKECIYRISYITNNPVKDVTEALIMSGLASTKVIDYLSQFFKRNFQYNSTIYMGDHTRTITIKINGKKERITTRLRDGHNETYDLIKQLAYALDCTPSMATAIILDASIKNTESVNEYMRKYLEQELDPGRMKELKEVLKYINQNNPYQEEVSISALLFHLLDEMKISASNLGGSIQSWLDKVKGN